MKLALLAFMLVTLALVPASAPAGDTPSAAVSSFNPLGAWDGEYRSSLGGKGDFSFTIQSVEGEKITGKVRIGGPRGGYAYSYHNKDLDFVGSWKGGVLDLRAGFIWIQMRPSGSELMEGNLTATMISEVWVKRVK